MTRTSFSLTLLLLTAAATVHADDVQPIARSHAHNDYEHERPLFDALAQGFTSVEADIWLVDGELLIGHDEADTASGRKLEDLYLAPLKALIEKQDGYVYPGYTHSIELLIDVKSEAGPTYRALAALLARYSDILTLFTPGAVRENAVTAVISGNRALAALSAQHVRYAAYDGRADDLGTDADAAFIPLISENWSKLFSWTGTGAFPDEQRQSLRDVVSAAHAKQRRVRFWATPEDVELREAVWSELVAAGVDYINTDDLPALRAFLLKSDPHPSDPEVDWFGKWHRFHAR
jgi:hypothetical protein